MSLVHVFVAGERPRRHVVDRAQPGPLQRASCSASPTGSSASGSCSIYRSSRVINFAYGEIGALAAVMFAKAVLDWGWNYLRRHPRGHGGQRPALRVRRAHRRSPPVRRATRDPVRRDARRRPARAAAPVRVPATASRSACTRGRSRSTGTSQASTVRGEHLAVLVFVPVIVAALWYFLARHPDRPGDPGIGRQRRRGDPRRGPGPSLVDARLDARRRRSPARRPCSRARSTRRSSAAPGQAIGPGLLLRGLVAALIGGMVSIPLTVLGGVIVGVLEALLYFNVIANAFARRHRPLRVRAAARALPPPARAARAGRDAERGPSRRGRARSRVSLRTSDGFAGSRGSPASLALALAALLSPIATTSASDQFLYSRVLLFAIVGLSVTLLTGWAGQLSLGQFAFVGIGGFTAASLVQGRLLFRARGRPCGAAHAPGRSRRRRALACGSVDCSSRSPRSRSRSPRRAGC